MKKRLFAVLAIFALVGTALFAEEAGDADAAYEGLCCSSRGIRCYFWHCQIFRKRMML